METIELIYIGIRFYCESNTMMSSIYTESGERYDWTLCELALSKGYKKINIRPANKDELEYYEDKLNQYKQRWGQNVKN